MSVEQNSISSKDKIYDVLIVGAGPVGLATAIALRKRGIDNILVIDRTQSFRRVGQVVDILPNGLKAIKYMDDRAYKKLLQTKLNLLKPQEKKTARPRAWNQKNLQGKIIYSNSLEFETWFNRYGEGRISLSWYDLQTTLRNLLPPEIVRANHRCIEVTKGDELIQITCICEPDICCDRNPFAYWESSKLEQFKSDSTNELNESTDVTPSKPDLDKESEFDRREFRARLVVAADGINSTLRQIIYENSELSQWAKPKYSGFAAIGCLQIDDVPDEIIQQLEDKYFQGDRVITLRHDSAKSNSKDLELSRLILLRGNNNTLGYLLHTPLDLDSIQNKSPEETICLAVEVLKEANFPPIFGHLVNLSPTERLFYRPYYIHPANIPIDSKPVWSSGRLVLVGDAAHGMPPFAAQGANQGFEDAALISALITKIINNNALDNEKMIVNEFSKYEKIRRPFMMEVQKATMNSQRWLEKDWNDFADKVYGRDLNQLICNSV
ncbi:MAG: FAD-dependent oxidoreductase [Xenococcaceae cyanobacterium]